MNNPNIRPAQKGDIPAIIGVALSSGLFAPDEAPLVQDMLDEYFANAPAGHHWLVAQDAEVVGAAYVAPEAMADGVLNLYFIAVSRPVHRRGIGGALLDEVEQIAGVADARLLLIETSSASEQAAARTFYEGRGYEMQGRIVDYYQPGDDKIIFARRLADG